MKWNNLRYLALLILALVGCGSPQPKQVSAPPPPHIVTNILVAPPAATTQIGQVQTFEAREIQNQVASPCTACTWKSDNPAVATVGQGVATALAPGVAHIVASLGASQSEPVTLSVQTPPPPPTDPPPVDLAGTWNGVIESDGFASGQFSIPMVKGNLCNAGNSPQTCYQSDFWAETQEGTFCLLLGVYGFDAEVNLDGTIAFQIVEKGGDGLWVTYVGTLPPLDKSSLTTTGTWTEDISGSSPCYTDYGTSGALSISVSAGS
jgi:hypothetical protein